MSRTETPEFGNRAMYIEQHVLDVSLSDNVSQLSSENQK